MGLQLNGMTAAGVGEGAESGASLPFPAGGVWSLRPGESVTMRRTEVSTPARAMEAVRRTERAIAALSEAIDAEAAETIAEIEGLILRYPSGDADPEPPRAA